VKERRKEEKGGKTKQSFICQQRGGKKSKGKMRKKDENRKLRNQRNRNRLPEETIKNARRTSVKPAPSPQTETSGIKEFAKEQPQGRRFKKAQQKVRGARGRSFPVTKKNI